MTSTRRRAALLAIASLTSLGVLAGGATAERGPSKPGKAFSKWAKSMKLAGPAAAATADPDKDGLRNWGEYRSGTNPKRRDSDGDRVSDAFEDRDRDGLTNGVEDRLGTDCRSRDDIDDIDEGEIEVKGKVVSFAAPSASAAGAVVLEFAGTQSTLGLPQGSTVRGASLLTAGALVKVEIEIEHGRPEVKVRSLIAGATSTTTGGTTTGGSTTGSTTSDDDRDD